MPKLKMFPVEVAINEQGDVVLLQEHDGDEEDCICLHYSQVPMVLEWLKAVAAEAAAMQADGA